MSKSIRIQGAKVHNLKNLSVEIPRDQLVVFTGLSGSGKSSLAFDTIYAEGQRRYVESLSAYARQFLGQMDKPDVEFIEGLSPAISIDQKTASRNPRSTVGTITEIHDYLRLLFARIGVPYCPNCGKRHHQPDAPADRRPGPRASRRRALPRARDGRRGTKGRVQHAAQRAGGPGLLARARRRRRHGAVRARLAQPRALRAAHDRCRARPTDREVVQPPAPHRVGRVGAEAHQGRRQVPLPRSRRDGAVLREDGVQRLRDQLQRARAT